MSQTNEQVMREALELIVRYFGPCQHEYIFSKRYAIDKARAALAAQAVQSAPVAWCNGDALLSFKCGNELPLKLSETKDGFYKTPLYTHPAPVRQPLTPDQVAEIGKATNSEVSKLEAEGRYTFAGWLPIAVRLTEAAHGITAQGAAHD